MRLAGLILAALALAACKPAGVARTHDSAALVPVSAAPPPPDWLEGDNAAPPPAPAGEPPASHKTAEIAQERIVQKDLPKSADPLWALLRTTRVSEDPRTGIYLADHPPQVQALAGKTLTVSGFMLPIDQGDEPTTRHFLISRYTPVCFFCPPGDPNEVIEVRTKTALKAGFDMVKVTGTFSLANNGEKGLFFRLDAG